MLANSPWPLKPWRVSYRNTGSEDQVLVATLKSQNDHIQVKDSGLFEIIEVSWLSAFEVLLLTFVLFQVMDSQCPGSVIADAATYKVDWVPRPSVSLSQTEANYEPYNNSHILPAICEGIEDHVDLDLKGALLIIEWKVELWLFIRYKCRSAAIPNHV
jgi:nucleoporin POM152